MSILEHFDHPARKQEKEHFNHLVQIAKADGIIDDSESEMLHRIGRNMGLTEPEIDDLLHSSKRSDYIPPYELAKRFEQLYHIVKIVLADGEVNQNEMSLASKFAVKAGFNLKEIPHVLDLITEGIRNKSDEEDIFELYKKKRKSFI